jgi:flagellar biosynthesis regulator FlaF
MSDYMLLTEQGLVKVEDMTREQLIEVIDMLVAEQASASDRHMHNINFLSGDCRVQRPRYKS